MFCVINSTATENRGMDELAIAYAMLGALTIVLQVVSFAASRMQLGEFYDRMVCLEGRVEELGRETEAMAALSLCALRSDDSPCSRECSRHSVRKRDGNGSYPAHNKADMQGAARNNADMQGAGVSELLPSVEEAKPGSESESESESERAGRMKVKNWLRAAWSPPKIPVGSGTNQMCNFCILDQDQIPFPPHLPTSPPPTPLIGPDLTRASTKLDKPKTTQQRLCQPSPCNRTSPAEGGNMAAASSVRARAVGPAISSRKIAPIQKDDGIARNAAGKRFTSQPNHSKSLPSVLPQTGGNTPLAAAATVPSEIPRARKTIRAAQREAQPKTSSGSRFYSSVIKKLMREAPKRSTPCYTPPSSPIGIYM